MIEGRIVIMQWARLRSSGMRKDEPNNDAFIPCQGGTLPVNVEQPRGDL